MIYDHPDVYTLCDLYRIITSSNNTTSTHMTTVSINIHQSSIVALNMYATLDSQYEKNK